MNKVEPIRDTEKLKKCIEIARAHDNKTDGKLSWELMLIVGFNTALRISDLTKLKVKDLRDREKIKLKAQKTGKDTELYFSRDVQTRLHRLLRDRDGEDYVLQGRQKDSVTGCRRAISRQRAYQIINEIGNEAGLDHIGCHTLRKTYGYHYYKKTQDVAGLQEILGHSSPAITLRYIGINDDEKRARMQSFSIL